MLIRNILGPIRCEVRALELAVIEAERLMFIEKIYMDDIRVTRDIYPFVAKHMNKKCKTVARQIERLNNFCWDYMDETQKMKYIGKINRELREPREMIFFLAFYCYYGKPYYKVLDK